MLFYLHVKRGDRDRAGREPPCLFSLFFKSTLFCCYYDYTQIKVDPLQFQTIPYSYLYDQNTGVGFDPRGLTYIQYTFC